MSTAPRGGFWASFWRIARPYWTSDERWSAIGLFVTLIVLSLAIVFINVRLNLWNGDFYNSLEAKDFAAFKRLLGQFALLAFLYIVFAVYQQYLQQMLNIRWRRWLTDVYLQRWMQQAVHYRLSLADFGSDNPDQRIAEDLRDFVSYTLSLFFGLLSSVVTLVSFVGILWTLSGAVTLAGVTIPGYMVWVAIAYAGLGSLLAHWIGRPLIGLNFQQERFEADFRFALVRARENAEGIALYRGEADELAGFRQRFARVVQNWWAIMRRQKRFTWFASFYGQLAIIFPILVASPRYFSGAIPLGGLMQTAQAFGKVQESLSWLVDAYTTIANWRAAIARLEGFSQAIDAAKALGERPVPAGQPAQAAVIDLGRTTIDVPVALPARPVPPADSPSPAWRPDIEVPALPTRALLRTDHQTIAPGQHTLIVGPSGTGKSTLFRLLAGIWPFADGDARRLDDDEALFLPQRPYLPLGSLRAVLCYPRQSQGFTDDALRAALADMGLPRLGERLDEVANWTQVLSGGEQQRLAAARALLLAPRWLFLDEATSALDEAGERSVYERLIERLPRTTLVSIAHRPTVARFHRQVLRVTPQADAPATLHAEALPAAAPDTAG